MSAHSKSHALHTPIGRYTAMREHQMLFPSQSTAATGSALSNFAEYSLTNHCPMVILIPSEVVVLIGRPHCAIDVTTCIVCKSLLPYFRLMTMLKS